LPTRLNGATEGKTPVITIDGSKGEGGGQILRTALSLSMTTGQPVELQNIRARRSKPGLLRQHLTAVNAAIEVCGAEAEGAAMHSSYLIFFPGPIRSGDFQFDVGTAGSSTLVLQTVLPVLCCATESSSVVVKGGTHNPHAPPFDFLQRSFLPLVSRINAQVDLKLRRAGFYPAGGGEIAATVWPGANSTPLSLLDRGKPIANEAIAMVANLPTEIASRELKVVSKKLGWPQKSLTQRVMKDSIGPGNVVMLSLKYENVNELFVAFGQRGVPAERVAQKAIKQWKEYERHDAPVGPHLADQLLLPLALSGGGEFRTCALTEHAKTNLATIKRFLEISIETRTLDDETVLVTIR